MPLRKKTLRRMPPLTRRMARVLGEIESAHTKLRNILEDVQSLERWERAATQAHHPMCSWHKSGAGNTCTCFVGKAKAAITKAEKGAQR